MPEGFTISGDAKASPVAAAPAPAPKENGTAAPAPSANGTAGSTGGRLFKKQQDGWQICTYILPRCLSVVLVFESVLVNFPDGAVKVVCDVCIRYGAASTSIASRDGWYSALTGNAEKLHK